MSESESVIDFAGLDSATSATDSAAVTTPVETTTADAAAVETSTKGSEEAVVDSTKKDAKQQYNSDGTPKEAAVEKEEDLPGTEKTPQEIRKALKAFRDADPAANGEAVKQLHGAYERWEAAKAIYPGGINEMKQAKEFMDLVGGHEGYEKLTGVKAAAEASDAQLYEGAPELITAIVEDLKAHNKLDALPKLAPAFLDAVKANNGEAYYDIMAPHFFSGLEAVNMGGAIGGLVRALADPDPDKAIAAIKEVVTGPNGMQNWYKGLEAENKKKAAAVVSPERKQLDKERADFLKQQEDFKTNQSNEFKNSVAKTCESFNNKGLGKELGPYINKPFFASFKRENWMPLGNTMKSDLYATLKADSAYQAQMKAMWGAKEPDRAKIEEYHKARVESLAADIVRNAVQKMYPGYAKGGAAAGRVAAAAVKKEATGKVEAAATATGKPIYVAAKPAWDSIDWEKDPKQLLYITGKCYLKGSGKYVTWRK